MIIDFLSHWFLSCCLLYFPTFISLPPNFLRLYFRLFSLSFMAFLFLFSSEVTRFVLSHSLQFNYLFFPIVLLYVCHLYYFFCLVFFLFTHSLSLFLFLTDLFLYLTNSFSFSLFTDFLSLTDTFYSSFSLTLPLSH